MEVGDNLRRIISDRGFKHSFVARKAGLSDKSFSGLLCGRKVFRIEHLISICHIIGTTPDEVLGFAEYETPDK